MISIKDMTFIFKYRARHWAFQWVHDDEGDIGIQIFGIVTLNKYKEHTLILWFKNYKETPKYV